MKKTTVFPWYIFLLPLFYILHVYNDYFGILDIGLVSLYLLYYLLLSLIVFSIAFLLFRNSAKAGILTISFLIVFFFFGAAHYFLKTLHTPSFFVSYKFLFSLTLIFFITLAVKMKKKNEPLKANRFFLYLFLLFTVLEAGITLYNIFSKKCALASRSEVDQ